MELWRLLDREMEIEENISTRECWLKSRKYKGLFDENRIQREIIELQGQLKLLRELIKDKSIKIKLEKEQREKDRVDFEIQMKIRKDKRKGL